MKLIEFPQKLNVALQLVVEGTQVSHAQKSPNEIVHTENTWKGLEGNDILLTTLNTRISAKIYLDVSLHLFIIDEISMCLDNINCKLGTLS